MCELNSWAHIWCGSGFVLKTRCYKSGIRSMSVCEYPNRFTQLSRYAPKEVDSDAKKQKHFLKGLDDGLQL